MAQKYLPGIAHERMADGCCPECGKRPEEHAGAWSMEAMFGPCNLLAAGVVERIEQYRTDSMADATPVKVMVCTRCNATPPTEPSSTPWATWEWTPATMNYADGTLYVTPHAPSCHNLPPTSRED